VVLTRFKYLNTGKTGGRGVFKEEKRQLKSFLKTVEFIKTLLDSLPPAENIHLNLLFGNAKNQCDILVGLTLKVAELNAAALFFGQTVDNLAYQIHLVVDNGLPGRVVCCIYLVAAAIDEGEARMPDGENWKRAKIVRALMEKKGDRYVWRRWF